jgi:intein/homing endonuclease
MRNPVSKNGRKTVKDNSPFKLDPEFIAKFTGKKPKFGYNGLGEFVFYRTYSRLKDDGKKETFVDMLQRVVEGCYEIQRVWCEKKKNGEEKNSDGEEKKDGVAFGGMALPWTRAKAQKSAQEMFQRMWDFKFLPPGRGLWVMGTPHMWKVGSSALNNCGFCSTQDITEDPAWQFCFVMDMSMLGVGVGFDTRGANKVTAVKPHDLETEWVIEDSREGWVDSLRALIESFTVRPELGIVRFDYSLIRPAGSEIKGFGGKASGPDTLKDLHRMVTKQFHNILRRKSRLITSVDIVDFMNFIGRCVVAGNVRRSSEIALGDPADWDYMQMKDKTLFSEQLNSHRWASNNSIFAKVGMDYRRVAEQIAGNGEPGCLWLDNVQNYGRAIDGRQEGIDKRAIGTNPCFTGDTRLLTADGYARLEDIWMATGQHEYHSLGNDPLSIYGEMRIVNKNGLVPATNVYRTGMGVDLFRVRFSDGSSIDATATHEFITLTRQRVQKKVHYDEQRTFLRDLKIGDMIPLNHAVHFGTYHDPAYAELAGWTIGDGSLSPKKDGQIRAQCTCYESDIDVVLPKLRGLMFELYAAHNMSSNQTPAYAGWHREQEYFEHDEMTIGSNVLGRMLRSDGVDSGAKHVVPNSVWCGTRETVAAFLRGFASADGYIHITDNGTISARIWQANRELLLDCRLLLSQFGIASSVKFRRETHKQLMNDGKGGKKLYDCKTGWELIISGRKQVEAFLDQIGFIQPEKMLEARKWLSEHRGSNNSNTGRYTHVVSVEPIGKGDTYCLTEPSEHRIVVEGCEVGNCGEQSLEDAELCCLCETFPAHHEDAADYHRTLKFAYLYAKTVTLLPTHCKKTNSVLLRNRRIGLSQSGIIQAFAKFGRRQVLEDFCNKGYEVVRHWDEIYSEWLCVSKSLKCTSVKPSGSVSLLAGATAGIHFTIAPTRSYWRNVRVASDSTLIKSLLEAGYHVEKAVTDDKTSVVRFGVSEPDVPSVSEISIWQQTKNAVDYQRYWADNQVSCTIQFKPEEAKDIPFVLESFDDELKGVSFLPIENNGYPQQPYQPATPEEVAAYNAKLKPLNFDKDLMDDAIGTKFCDGDTCQI